LTRRANHRHNVIIAKIFKPARRNPSRAFCLKSPNRTAAAHRRRNSQRPTLGVASVNRLVLPAGTPLRLQLTSASVMNSFFVPQLGSQIYTMAGMTTTLHLQADQAGTYPGLSAQFSGDGFSDMRFDAVALPPAQFAQWLAGARGGGATLDSAQFAALAKPGIAPQALVYAHVAPGLFETILAATAKPAPAAMAMQ